MTERLEGQDWEQDLSETAYRMYRNLGGKNWELRFKMQVASQNAQLNDILFRFLFVFVIL